MHEYAKQDFIKLFLVLWRWLFTSENPEAVYTVSPATQVQHCNTHASTQIYAHTNLRAEYALDTKTYTGTGYTENRIISAWG